MYSSSEVLPVPSQTSLGTNQLSIYYSNSSTSDWTLVMTGNLKDVRSLACESIPSQSFKVLKVARFLKIDLETSHAAGSGIKYLNANFKDPICGMVTSSKLIFLISFTKKKLMVLVFMVFCWWCKNWRCPHPKYFEGIYITYAEGFAYSQDLLESHVVICSSSDYQNRWD